MSKAAFRKSSLRVVKTTFTRFISIVLISFLGAGVFAGLSATSPNMKLTGDAYYDKYNVADAQILSTYGFDDSDINAIKDIHGIREVLATYSIDSTGSVESKDYTFKISGFPDRKDAQINQVKLIDGQMPKAQNEAIIIQPSIGLKNIKIGSNITLDKSSNTAFSSTLDRNDFEIVGIAESPYYLSFMQGSTTVGSGSIDYVIYVPKDNFIIDSYTELLVTFDNTKNLNTFEDEYFKACEKPLDKLSIMAKERQDLRYTKLKKDLKDGHKELSVVRKDTEKQLDDAELQLEAAKTQIETSKVLYQNGVSEYNTKKGLAESELTIAENKLSAAEKNIMQGEQELSKKQSELQNNKLLLAEGRRKLDTAWTDYNQQYAAYLAIKDFLWSTNPEQAALLEQQLNAYRVQLDQEEQAYTNNSDKLKAAQILLNQKQGEINQAKIDYQNSIITYNQNKELVDAELYNAEISLKTAENQIQTAENELKIKWAEFDEQKKATITKLEDSEVLLNEQEDIVSKMGTPKWFVLDRNMNESFINFYDTTKKMRDLATIFPVIFFLVAALVCLTTMTRMVDEDRILIGTFKALGYSKRTIAMRYLLYAIIASFIGSLLGVLVGFWLLPHIIWNAYAIIFAFPTLHTRFFLDTATLSVLAIVITIGLTTGFSIKRSLDEVPSELMRPKAPKSGKRVFIENIKLIWNRLSFTRKVTIRNLGLNKKRLVMALLGILGCTALVVTAFGIKNSIQSISSKQFQTILKYDISVGYSDKPSNELATFMSNESYFNEAVEAYRGAAIARDKKNSNTTESISVVAPKDSKEFNNVVKFYDPSNHKSIQFTTNSVVITEKLAINLNLDIGDKIEIKYLNDDTYHSLEITDISENYTFNYIYIGDDVYMDIFNEPASYNYYFSILNDNIDKRIVEAKLHEINGVSVISFTKDLMGNIEKSIKSIDTIIWVLIIAAGLLAFVVIYNLTNINIGERQRELATLKVLGFYDNETYNYIFRETIAISIIACILGLFGGSFLYKAVVVTVEPSSIFLTRSLSWESYALAVILTMFFTLIVNMFLIPKIKHIDMLESLKSVD
ncbi:putative ABC transport system permease protein [Breznakia sp. PF5-3]|uniref:FtsX-like permease family protein n=1 Tax=unclassified Breznakia TaxID=2623764 RepID=UPI0024064C5D|nr:MULTISPECIES: FtsX-like permease family protein [unclassified Breznakia]MDF9824820.1 putative ABC transport system permease protein [Breznakia sp. PM6-1]MDF9835218.1 putative ABC transport system permease protein [Breznakia sp. PF5-3]MDF9837330.1 putative ABC transport system permease protein [Breznakia sp. PFB2-8]MDF9859746.1 putative ABC transport system permease protein [Breznakia sp. PH5-24]